MTFDGADRDGESLRDVLVGQARRSEVGDLPLARRQRQRLRGRDQRRRPQATALRRESVRHRGRRHGRGPSARRVVQDTGLRGRVRGGQAHPGVLERRRAQIEFDSIAVAERRGVARVQIRERTVDALGQFGEPVGDAAVPEPGGGVQGLGLHRELTGGTGGCGRGVREFDGGRDGSGGRRLPGRRDGEHGPEDGHMLAGTFPRLGQRGRGTIGLSQRTQGLHQEDVGREVPRLGEPATVEDGEGLLHPPGHRGARSAGEFDCGDEYSGHRPAQVLRGLRGGHETPRGAVRVVEPAGEGQREGLAETGGEPEQSVHLDLARVFGQRPDLRSPTGDRTGEAATEDRPLHCPRQRPGFGEDGVGQRDRLVDPILEEGARRGDPGDDRRECRVGDPLGQQPQDLVGPIGVAQSPERVADDRIAPQHESTLVEIVGREAGQDVPRLVRMPLPHDRPREQLGLLESTALVERRPRESLAERRLREVQGIACGGPYQREVDLHVALDREIGEPNPLGRGVRGP